MHIKSLPGKWIHLRRTPPILWWQFVNGWWRRGQKNVVPCAFKGAKKLLWSPLVDFYPTYEFFCETKAGCHEISFFLERLRAPEVLYDIGAFRGAYSAAATMKGGSQISVHIFEPLGKNVEAIRRLTRINDFSNFKINPLAVSDGVSAVGGLNDAMMLQLGNNAVSDKTASFPATTVDEYIAAGNAPPSILKIDVEGFELHVLRGAVKCLEQYRPRLWLEVHPGFLKAQNKCPEDVLQLLRKAGCAISFFDDFSSANQENPYHIWCE